MFKWIVLLLVAIVGLVFVVTNKPALNVSTDSRLVPAQEENTNNQYVPYSPEAVAAAAGKQKLLFFHANWCPTCLITNQDILENSQKLPQDLVIFKTDYDSQTALKQKYNITYQHTFVLIDDQGNELKQWNGGGVDEINQQLI